ncbi:putative membrane protein YccC [Pseudomonas nitritireducens]|uniref:Putative membrane protein YccC n=1 Tax=Pseudomonas nitroreducens TaxID=46680 RepID=A0A7W7KS11_PSENT|nr:FUSC family protein [Pseudomonas nitritireducens]MBB4867510.1 putative membrane protein YccC [Pseudomonas nitritireducens]
MSPMLLYLRAILHPGRDTLLFALRTVLAGLLTLYLAFLLELDQPKWATMTVVIISTPLAGMTLHKSFALVLGTTIGALVAVAIVALFAQAPLPFVVSLALWLALCTAGATLLRFTYSHAFVLSGFSAVIIALLAQPIPESSYAQAITRVSEALLGVACVTLVSLFLARPQSVARGCFAKVDRLLRLIAVHAAAVIRGDEPEADFQQRQKHLLGEIAALEMLRRHLYFDAPHLHGANALVQQLANQLMLMTSRLALLRRQRKLLEAHRSGSLPESVRPLRQDELACLEALAEFGCALPGSVRRRITRLRQRFDAAARQAGELADGPPTSLRSLSWALRFERARLMQQLDGMIELGEAIQEGRPGSSSCRQSQTQALHLDFHLAAMNATRAFVALCCAGWLWVETAWDGARAGMLLIGILCALLATFPRPLLASLAYLRGLAMAVVAAALLQFLLLPSVGDLEMLALFLAPLLYVIAVGLANPQTAGIGVGLGLSIFLLVGPQGQGAWVDTALQWFKFAGGYVSAGVLALLIYAWVFPFDGDARLRRQSRRTRAEVRSVLLSKPSETRRLLFESRLVERLAILLGLLPAARDGQSDERFQCSLASMTLGVALHQLRRESLDAEGLPQALRQRLSLLLDELAACLDQPPAAPLRRVLLAMGELGSELDDLHSHGDARRPVLDSAAALLVAADLLERFRDLYGESSAFPSDHSTAALPAR